LDKNECLQSHKKDNQLNGLEISLNEINCAPYLIFFYILYLRRRLELITGIIRSYLFNDDEFQFVDFDEMFLEESTIFFYLTYSPHNRLYILFSFFDLICIEKTIFRYCINTGAVLTRQTSQRNYEKSETISEER
jgi:hypothetical protein